MDQSGRRDEQTDIWDVDRLAIDNADSYEELISQLYMTRVCRGLTADKVREALKLSAADFANLEAGHGNSAIATLQDYAEVLGAYLVLIAVPAHRAGEWKDRSRKVTEDLQKRQVQEVSGKSITTKVMYLVGWTAPAGT